MNKTKFLRILIALLIIIDMAVIFNFSNQRAAKSDQTSSSVIVTLVKMIHSDFDSWSDERQNETVQSWQFVVRKTAHMTEFASLGVLTCAFALTFGLKLKNLLLAFIFSVFYAATDEFHQLFVDGRSGQVSDVLVDSAGIFIGILCFTALTLLIGKIKLTAKSQCVKIYSSQRKDY
ncbi:MAG: VanZ family protein [Ruminococcus sp.]|nr:VanZ family protein [Ruminococcus sp.]